HLKEGIGLRGYAQRDPLVEYKREAYALFRGMMQLFASDMVEKFARVQIRAQEAEVSLPAARSQPMTMGHGAMEAFAAGGVDAAAQGGAVSAVGGGRTPFGAASVPSGQATMPHGPKVGRNDPCPCGSGKKYKKCCGM
ncbi:MAG: SEC-C domain-containing protein, partial [Deltaproteobacteria bacterium]|nr:SEC-C domain-containing protein [Deltaproteobacteria bacterium]